MIRRSFVIVDQLEMQYSLSVNKACILLIFRGFSLLQDEAQAICTPESKRKETKDERRNDCPVLIHPAAICVRRIDWKTLIMGMGRSWDDRSNKE